MALIPCPECGNSISDKSATCLKCGHAVASVSAASPTPIRAASAMSDVQWFYTAANGEQQGPVDAVFMQTAFRDG